MFKGLVFKGCFSPFGWLEIVIVVCRDKVSFERFFAGGCVVVLLFVYTLFIVAL